MNTPGGGGWVTAAADMNQARTVRPDYSPAYDLVLIDLFLLDLL